MLRLFRNLLPLLLAVTFAASGALASDSPVLDRVIESKTLRVGMSGNQPPMNTMSRSGQLIGYDVDLARSLALAMGAELDIVTMPFGDLIDSLESGKIDMVMSGMAITADRSRHVSFVGPYMMSGKSILTKSSVLADARSAGDFNRSELRLAALTNSTSQEFIEEVAPEAKLVKVKDYEDAIKMVIDGKVDALVADMPVCRLTVMRYPGEGLVTLKEPLSVEPFGIAVSLNDARFAELVDNYLDTYTRMGTLAALRQKWFEDTSWVAALP